jgi:hypothetical protein
MARRGSLVWLGVLASVVVGFAAAAPAGAVPRASVRVSADPCANLSPAVTAECRKGVTACAKAASVSAALGQKCLAELTSGLDPLRKKAATSSTGSSDTGSATSGDSGASAAGASRRSVSTTRSHVVASVTSIPADGVAPIVVHVILKDVAGGAIAGDTVHLHAPGSSAKILPASGVSDGTGLATFKVTDATAEHVTLHAQVENNGTAEVLPHALTVGFTPPSPSAAHSSITCGGCTVVQAAGGVSTQQPGTYACLASCTNSSGISLNVTIEDAAGVPLQGYQFWLEARTSPIKSAAAFFQINPNTWTNADPQNKGLYRGIETTNAQGKASLTVYLNTLRFKDNPGTATFLVCAPLSDFGPYFASFEALYANAN